MTSLQCLKICIESEDRAFEHDVTVAMLVFQFKIILTIDSFGWNTNMAAMAFVEFWSLGNECKRSTSPIIIRQPKYF